MKLTSTLKTTTVHVVKKTVTVNYITFQVFSDSDGQISTNFVYSVTLTRHYAHFTFQEFSFRFRKIFFLKRYCEHELNLTSLLYWRDISHTSIRRSRARQFTVHVPIKTARVLSPVPQKWNFNILDSRK